jgi:hypothetical protein
MYWIFTIAARVPADHHSALREEAHRLRKRIKQQIETMTCPTHGRGPTIEVTGFGPGQFDLQVRGCCSTFVRRVKWRIEG